MLSTSSKLHSTAASSSPPPLEHTMVKKASVLLQMALNPYAGPYFSLSSYSSSPSPSCMSHTSIYYAYPPPPTSWPYNNNNYNYNYIPTYDSTYRYHFFPTKQFTVPANYSPAAEETRPPPPPAEAAVGPTEPEEEAAGESVAEKKTNKKKAKGFYDKYYGDFRRTGRRHKEDFRFKKEEPCLKTTVMIKNIPNKMNKNELLEILDAHCMKVNQKILECDNDERSCLSEFDFLYLPIDFSSGSNLGYAFLNFTSAIAAWRLYNDLHNTSWNKYGSRKVCEITYARLQGLSLLEAHFKNSVFNCESDDYLPVIFGPCRNGLGLSEYRYVARRFSLR